MNEQLANELALLREFGFTHLDVRAQGAGGGAQVMDASQAALLAEMAKVASACEKCKLAKTRTNVVYGVGNPNADLMFIGEAPGRDEDLKGEPFVGRAGQLLTDIIKAMKLTRDDVYIANVIKCRPLIRRQIEIIQPKVIVTLGRFALQSLMERGYAISGARGQWLDFHGIKVMPTYHPAYLLRNPAAKKDVWADMKKVMAELSSASAEMTAP